MKIEELAFKDYQELKDIQKIDLLLIIEFLQKDRKQWINQYSKVHNDYVYLQKELEQLKEIEKEHQRINGCLHLEIKELKEKYMKLEDKYIHNVSCCNEEDCDLFCEHQELKKQLEEWKELLNKFKIQQKEFIEFLEKMWKETQDIWYIKILQKYKEIIGDKE